jgi:hypothetical protein
MTRAELDSIAAFLRARLGAASPAAAPLPADHLAPTATATAARRLRTVEQAVLGVDAYLELAAHQPAPPGLAAEQQRARALWETLLDLAAQWPDHPDNPRLAGSPPERVSSAAVANRQPAA